MKEQRGATSVKHGDALSCCPSWNTKPPTARARQRFIGLRNSSATPEISPVTQQGSTNHREELRMFHVTATRLLALQARGSGLSSCLPPQHGSNERSLAPIKNCRFAGRNTAGNTSHSDDNEKNVIVAYRKNMYVHSASNSTCCNISRASLFIHGMSTNNYG